eukprot:TRINITY_DN1905_c0_g1_i1.p1 TRINITY_DN1905_c0_g1~~TRINITY_DN1905_c0_g1_i1.p1  ORF type:complete len:363 (+),score=69.15 TRINITY_DN1905_c0_g1_i1:59-1147(+)
MSTPTERVRMIASHVTQSVSAAEVSAELPTLGPFRVAVTGAAGQISYSLLFEICSGRTFGPNRPIILQLLEVAPALPALKGVAMELDDCAFPLLREVITTSDPRVAFKDADVAVLVGAMPRKPGMQRKDLLSANAAIFKEHGSALNDVASRDVKVLVVGNPANTNCYVAYKSAPSLNPNNFSALTRLDQNRAYLQISKKLNVSITSLSNIFIWGNHSLTQFPDINHALVRLPVSGAETGVRSAVNDDEWVLKSFIPTVQQRGAAVLAARKLSSAASAAIAISDHLHDWILGTAPGKFVSMAIPSDGSYGISKGLVFSFPVECRNGSYRIVQGYKFDSVSAQLIELTKKELEEEKDALASIGI